MKIKVACLFGGCSSEYDISLESASSILESIDREKYEIIMIGITKEGGFYLYDGAIENIKTNEWREEENHEITFTMTRDEHYIIDLVNHNRIKIDIAFPILHGKNGEDGKLQGFFELINLPYVGCNMISSALCMDKFLAHELVRREGIFAPKSYLYKKDFSYDKVVEDVNGLSYPVFVKPVKAGSSLGISKVNNEEELKTAIENAFSYDDEIVVEEMIDGFEVGSAIMGNRDLIVGEVDEIELEDGFFDYEKKYASKVSRIHLPARLEREEKERIKKVAREIYRILGCNGLARIDMFYTKDKKIVFNEVNTIPGFTSHSRYPSMLKEIGYDFKSIIDKVIELGLEK